MTMNKIEVDELLKVLEAIREEKYPEIPPEFIKDIVHAQFENQDNRSQGYQDTKKFVDDFLKQVVSEG